VLLETILLTYRTVAGVLAVVETSQIAKEIGGELLVDLQEHILKVRHGDTVGSDVELVKSLIKSLEEATEVLCLRLRDHEGDLVADTEAVLEEEGAADALKGALAHNADAVTEDISLIHVMGSENNNSVFLVALEHVPKVAPGTQVHAGGRLVQEDKSRPATESDRDRKLAFVSTRESFGGLPLVNSQTHITDERVEFLLFSFGFASF
jgi:hypothetical protein